LTQRFKVDMLNGSFRVTSRLCFPGSENI